MMKRRDLLGTVVTTFSLLPLASSAQPAVVQSPGSSELWSEVRRDINRYKWVFGGRVSQPVGLWSVAATSRFTSDAFVLFDNQLSFRDEYSLSGSGRRHVAGSTSMHISTDVNWYSLSRVLSGQTYVGARLEPLTSFWLEPRVGIALDRRPGASVSSGLAPLRADVGPAAGWLAGWESESERYRVSVRSVGDARRIDPRRDLAFHVRGTATGAFERTSWSMAATASSFRRDTYETASFLNRDSQSSLVAETIEQTISDTLAWSGELDTPIYGPIRFLSRGEVAFNRRGVRAGRQLEETVFFETDFGRRTIDLDASSVVETSRIRLLVGILVGAEAETRTLANRSELPPIQAAQKATLLQQADSDRGFYGLSTSGRFDIGRRSTVTTEALIRLTRHDTPEVNPDDRDERSMSAQVALRTRLTRALDFDARLFASQYETVYLRAERSAENNTQTSLRLQTAVSWHSSSRTRVRIGPEVRATYTVDSFKLEGRPTRDQSARELRYNAEIEHRIVDDLVLRASGTRSDLRLGRFLESQFSEIPFDTLRATSGDLRLQIGTRHTAEIGVRIFVRSDFNLASRVSHIRRDVDGNILTDASGTPLMFTTTRPGRDIVRQIGPVAAIAWNLRNASILRIDGWLTIQKQYQKLFGDLPVQDAAEIERAAQAGMTRVIPNVAMSIVWRI